MTSLAKSAALLAKTLPPSAAGEDIRGAIETAERRVSGLMQFVDGHREIACSPTIQLETFSVSVLLRDLQLLLFAEWPSEKVPLEIRVVPLDQQMRADRQLLEHVLINLLRNAAQATVGYCPTPVVVASAGMAHGGRTLINIEDNGSGIAETIRSDVFLPFFTTKAEGSGIGLSLARQIVLAHGGSSRVETSVMGGACLRVVV